jgi:hypothetical protein
MPIKTETREIPANLLTVDPRVQRALDPRRVKRIADEWDDLMVGVLTVSHRVPYTLPGTEGRSPEEFVVLDGQTRLAAFRQVCGETTSLPMAAQVHTGLTIEEEALIFLKHNNRKAVLLTDRFRLAVVAGQTWAVEIAEVLAKHNWTAHGAVVGDAPARRQFSAVRAAEVVHKAGGKDALDKTLTTIENAWGSKRREAVCAQTLYGIGMLHARHPELTRDQVHSLVIKLAKIPPGTFTGQITQDARRYNQSHRVTAQAYVLEIFNKGRTASGRLV